MTARESTFTSPAEHNPAGARADAGLERAVRMRLPKPSGTPQRQIAGPPMELKLPLAYGVDHMNKFRVASFKFRVKIVELE